MLRTVVAFLEAKSSLQLAIVRDSSFTFRQKKVNTTLRLEWLVSGEKTVPLITKTDAMLIQFSCLQICLFSVFFLQAESGLLEPDVIGYQKHTKLILTTETLPNYIIL